MATNTPRLGLIKPAGSEARAVGPLNTNSDLADKFMPCILVNDGVTPPTGDLYDGALVKERTSGIVWEARKNGGGTYDKVYVNYPLNFEGFKINTTVANNGYPNFTAIGIDTVTTANCKNTSAANMVSGKFVVPVKGIYTARFRASFGGNATGVRGMTWQLNGSSIVGTEAVIERGPIDASGDESLEIVINRIFNLNDTVGVAVYQTCGGNLTCTMAHIQIALIDPIQ